MEVEVNGESVELERRNYASVHELLNVLDVSTPNESLRVRINRAPIPRDRWLKHGVEPGDEIVIEYT